MIYIKEIVIPLSLQNREHHSPGCRSGRGVLHSYIPATFLHTHTHGGPGIHSRNTPANKNGQPGASAASFREQAMRNGNLRSSPHP